MDADTDESIYREYISEAFRAVTNGMAAFCGGSTITKSYNEVLQATYEPEPQHTSKDIINNFVDKFNAL